MTKDVDDKNVPSSTDTVNSRYEDTELLKDAVAAADNFLSEEEAVEWKDKMDIRYNSK